MHALMRVIVVGLCVCLSGLNLLLQGSRYYTLCFHYDSMQGLICVEFDKNVRVESYDEKYLSRQS